MKEQERSVATPRIYPRPQEIPVCLLNARTRHTIKTTVMSFPGEEETLTLGRALFDLERCLGIDLDDREWMFTKFTKI